MSSKTARKFYHFTRKENIEGILNSYLYPGKVIGKNNNYHEMRGDPSYIYLFNENRARGSIEFEMISPEIAVFRRETHSLLEITLPLSHPIENDYDKLLFIFSDLEKKDWKKLVVEPFFWRLGMHFQGDLTKENLIYYMSLVSDDAWFGNVGSYRTSKPIPGKNIKEVGFDYLLLDKK